MKLHLLQDEEQDCHILIADNHEEVDSLYR